MRVSLGACCEKKSLGQHAGAVKREELCQRHGKQCNLWLERCCHLQIEVLSVESLIHFHLLTTPSLSEQLINLQSKRCLRCFHQVQLCRANSYKVWPNRGW